MEGVQEALNSKEEMMEWLEAGTQHLGLLVNMGSSAAEVCRASLLPSISDFLFS